MGVKFVDITFSIMKGEKISNRSTVRFDDYESRKKRFFFIIWRVRFV